jgi:hypothetical protein
LQNRVATYHAAGNSEIKPFKTEGTVEIKIEVNWGEKEGPKIGGGLSGGLQNTNGSYGKVKIDYQKNGEITVEAKGGYDPAKDALK